MEAAMEAQHRDAATIRPETRREEALPLRPRHHLPAEVPPLWLTLLARWAADAPRLRARTVQQPPDG
ncbi:MAG TPA: hypothetical protein VD970_15845 [Acetobacteraceae bacterium]|nr:hypothetical protein [Acetobacteraceae bacterium]